jgi:hypothetical protein
MSGLPEVKVVTHSNERFGQKEIREDDRKPGITVA